ncbi:MAG: hypothetical protein U5O16_21395 [Rhodococcus sp. (in: high G+C Gram-positive bacteria)]|uniref:hypothetical protein n=1 Tax=Rhodococcus sp. TaxID=1831 RepID=UPI002AD62D85|nr:hypothetical protein [Rhodococcus sp. (in: high G+C Gram-positive bacteria)]
MANIGDPCAKLAPMSGPAKLVVTDGAGARQVLADFVMAWARDAATGEPRYILELDSRHRGARCGCECPACGKPLTAVNAAREAFLRRPHFRHPKGAQRAECLVLAARAAVLRQLQEAGWLELPRRRMSARVAGLSGEFHEAWVEEAAVRVRISEVDYRDSATAVITLDDGRKLRVELTGTPGGPDPLAPDGQLVPTIYLTIDDPQLAALEPEELRRRARLEPNEMCWRAHWNDARLLDQAEAAARAQAHFYFDDIPPGLDLPEWLDPALRRETVLHYEVKRILESVGRITVPEVAVEVGRPGVGGQTLHRRWVAKGEDLRLASVRLETRYGRLIPDITCESFDADGQPRHLPLLIEVTVTNPIDEVRLGRIRATGKAALEIDLSLAGGRVNRDELVRLVVEEVATKRWLFHPEMERQRCALQDGLAKQVADEQGELDARAKHLAERRAQVLATPVSEIAAEYLDAVTRMYDAESGDVDGMRVARQLVVDAADKLAMHGYPEAGDENLIGSSSILARVLSIMLGRPVGYRYDNVMGVLNAIRQTSGPRLSTLSIYFIAARAYPLQLSGQEREWFDSWAREVRQSIKAGETRYLRTPVFDRLLSLLFPEMAPGLAMPGGKLAAGSEVQCDQASGKFAPPAVGHRVGVDLVDTQPRPNRGEPKLLDTKPSDGWLKGRDLEAWKRANPEAARSRFHGPREE